LACLLVAGVTRPAVGLRGRDCVNANQCSEDEDTPLCRLSNYDNDGELVDDTMSCMECDPNLPDGPTENAMRSQCAPGYFCVRRDFSGHPEYDDAVMGECVKMDWPLGEACVDRDFLGAYAPGGLPRSGKEDDLFCGLVTKWCDDGDDGTAACSGADNDQAAAPYVQWEGACIDNVCYECDVEYRVDEFGYVNKMCVNKAGFRGRGGTVHEYRVTDVEDVSLGATVVSGSGLTFNQNTMAKTLLGITFFIIFCWITMGLIMFGHKIGLREKAE